MSIALNYRYKSPDSPVLSGLTCCFPATVWVYAPSVYLPREPCRFFPETISNPPDPWIKALDPRLKGKDIFPLFYFHV